MDLRSRMGLALVILGIFLAGMLLLNAFGDTILSPVTYTADPSSRIDQVFSRAGFVYGPQGWRPSYDPIAITPGSETPDNESWYLMFVDLNTTPVTGNPQVKKLGAIRVTYNFTGLAGRAVFHVYGLTNSTAMPTRTNRQAGTSHCAFVVTGNATAGSMMPAAAPMAIPASRQYAVALANNRAADLQSMSATTRPFRFTGPGSGQGALHLTQNLSKPMGEVTVTDDLNGTFFITATGGDAGYDTILLAAVDRPQPDDFSLRIRAEFLRTR